jgi:hypothetical protein
VNDNNMESSSEIEKSTPMNVSAAPRSIVHLELFRAGVISHLDAIMSEENASMRDAMIIDARKFVDTYARAPSPAPRAPPVASERCIAIRAAAGGQQCTRRRKGDTNFCGTHVLYGQIEEAIVSDTVSSKPSTVKTPRSGTERAVRAAVSSSGIPQFVDDAGENWCAEDVCSEQINPRKV